MIILMVGRACVIGTKALAWTPITNLAQQRTPFKEKSKGVTGNFMKFPRQLSFQMTWP